MKQPVRITPDYLGRAGEEKGVQNDSKCRY